MKLRVAIVRESLHFPDEGFKMFSMQCNKDAGGLFVKVLYLCLLLIDISASLKIRNNISAIISTKKYDTDISLSETIVSSSIFGKKNEIFTLQ